MLAAECPWRATSRSGQSSSYLSAGSGLKAPGFTQPMQAQGLVRRAGPAYADRVLYAMTVDQRHSRRGRDLVDDALARVQPLAAAVRPFERTAGDEFQGLLDDPVRVVDVTLTLVRDAGWSVGIGIGEVDEPIPPSTRAARGLALERARRAVETAKGRNQHVAVIGPDERATDPEVVLTLLSAVLDRRTAAGWQAVDMVDSGRSVAETARALGITRQAVGQRLSVALWRPERDGRALAARLLERAT